MLDTSGALPSVLVGTGATITHTWYEDGTPTDPAGNQTTLGITRADGIELVPAGTAATRTDPGVYTFTLTPAHTVELDRLTVTWSGTFAGAVNTVKATLDVVGAHLFTEQQARAHGDRALADPTIYPDAVLWAARDRIASEFEAICGWSFLPRYARERLSGRGCPTLLLPHSRPLRVLAVTVNGASMSADDIAALHLTPEGVIVRADCAVWPQGAGNITVAYVHGWPLVPPAIGHAALELARFQLVPTNVSSRVTSYTDDAGQTSYFATAGRANSLGEIQHYGLPTVDAVLNRRQYNGSIPGVA